MLVGGARPNFVKLASLFSALRAVDSFELIFVHTGQHYDEILSGTFLRQLDLPAPDALLGIGSGTHAGQTARIMLGFEEVVERVRPEAIVLVGDVNSTLACALVAAKLDFGVKFLRCGLGSVRRPVAVHVEAGLRSFDWAMPEEINRVVTDRLSDLLFTTSSEAVENLKNEGICGERVFNVGNVMVDTLLKHADVAESSRILDALGLIPWSYGVVTVHRPSNVDDAASLRRVVSILERVQDELPLVFVVHPRTESRLRSAGMEGTVRALRRVTMLPSLAYLDFLRLMRHARVVLTDSGGVQEETTILGVPCLTLRDSTERPITVTNGTNHLVGLEVERIVEGVAAAGKMIEVPMPPPLWDGKASNRIAGILSEVFSV
jgi:UDP-N-acetylglucosamine 2-epimerase (non-hydrolysing)